MSPAGSMSLNRGSQAAVSPVLVTIGLTFLGLLFASGVQGLDPMVRHDDFPALLADPSGYYVKTLYEGRWLNYLWHLRPVVTPSWVTYLIYQFAWATYGACLAQSALGAQGALWHRVALALLIVLGPPALLISLWFNTLVPGLVLVALYAWLNTWVSVRRMRWLLVVFVPATLMSYTTYPLLLLVVCLLRSDAKRGFWDLVGLMALFIGSFALGMVSVFTLNYFAHGIFGIPMAEWRHATPAVDLASALENAKEIGVFLYDTARVISFNFMPLTVLHGLLLLAAALILGRRDPWRVTYALCGLAAGLGLIFLQTIKTGITLPVRVNGFAWATYAVMGTLLVQQLRDKGGWFERLSRNLLLFLVLSYMVGTIKQYITYSGWQVDTRAIAAEIGPGPEPVYITGTYRSLRTADRAGVQEPRGLRLRLTYLTGRRVFSCEEEPDRCHDLPADVLADPPPGSVEVRRLPDRVVLRLSSQAIWVVK